MNKVDHQLTIAVRRGMPTDLLDLLRKFPRGRWAGDPRIHGLAEGWIQRHEMFRELSVLTAKATADLREGRLAAETFLPLFQRRMGLLLSELETHHHVEDHHYFPAFAAAAPKLQKGFDILDNDHDVIHDSILSLNQASCELIAALSGEVSGHDGDAMRVAARLAGKITGFDRVLLRHLEDEEDLIIPLILERTRDDPDFR
ncbi:MAG: hemerythrin protein [Rhizobium sp.]|nr:hemerythrin protein [Rhizobium sp.]